MMIVIIMVISELIWLVLLTQLFRSNFIKLIRDIKQQTLPKLADKDNQGGATNLQQTLRKIIQGWTIETKLKYGLSTWQLEHSKKRYVLNQKRDCPSAESNVIHRYLITHSTDSIAIGTFR